MHSSFSLAFPPSVLQLFCSRKQFVCYMVFGQSLQQTRWKFHNHFIIIILFLQRIIYAHLVTGRACTSHTCIQRTKKLQLEYSIFIAQLVRIFHEASPHLRIIIIFIIIGVHRACPPPCGRSSQPKQNSSIKLASSLAQPVAKVENQTHVFIFRHNFTHDHVSSSTSTTHTHTHPHRYVYLLKFGRRVQWMRTEQSGEKH